MARGSKLGCGDRFWKCVESVEAGGSARDSRAVCAAAGRRRNPDELEKAGELSQAFHGRPPRSVKEYEMPVEERQDLADLGGLEELCIVAPGDDPYRPRSVIPIVFGHDVRLACSPDGKQLYFVGGDQSIDVQPFGVPMDKDLVVIGPVHSVAYYTAKHHLGPDDRKGAPYEHQFAEDGGELPILLYDCLNHTMTLAGGSYVIKKRDYEGQYSAGIRN